MCDTFEQYVRGSDAHLIFNVFLKYMYFYEYFYRYNIFLIALLVWILICTIYFIIRPWENLTSKDARQVLTNFMQGKK